MSFRRGRCWTYVRAGNFIQAPFASATQSAFKQPLSAPFPLEYTYTRKRPSSLLVAFMAVPDGFSTWYSKRPPILGGLFSNFIRDSIHQPVLNILKAADLYGSANLLVDCLADLHGERHRFFYFGFCFLSGHSLSLLYGSEYGFQKFDGGGGACHSVQIKDDCFAPLFISVLVYPVRLAYA